MEASDDLRRLIDANAPLWAGEAEVFRTYWDSPVRSHQTDMRWIAWQCRKEFWDSFGDDDLGLFLGPLEQLREAFPKIDITIGRHQVLEIMTSFYDEFVHYCALADIYDAVRNEDDPRLDPHRLKAMDDLAENIELGRLRAAHRRDHGRLGMRACRFTEGGYCTLFSEGMKLEGRGGIDDLIAEACAKIHDDEFRHMLKGVIGLDMEDYAAADWDLLTALTVAQMKVRVRMRNAQFSRPLADARIEAILAGDIAPLEFDYAWARVAD